VRKKIYSYFVSEFVKMLSVFLFGVIFVFILVNFFERIDRFLLRSRNPYAVLKYYFFQVPSLVVLLLPVAELLSAFFSVGTSARYNELLALKASGIDLRRIFIPILFVGVLNSFLSFLLSNTLSPYGLRRAREVRVIEIEGKEIKPRVKRARNLSFFGEKGRLFFFSYMDAERNFAKGISILEFHNGSLRKRIDAKRARFEEGRWILYDGIVRIMEGEEEKVSIFQEKELEDVRETPLDFLREKRKLEEMRLDEILKWIRIFRRAGLRTQEEEVEVHIRFSFPLANLIILLFSLPLASTMRGHGRAYGFGLAVILSFLYWAVLQFSKVLGQAGKIEPFLGAWAPNILFFLLSFFPLYKMRR